MNRILMAAVAFALVSIPLQAAAVPMGDPVRGQELAISCQACHGADGNAQGMPQFPRLAGQYQSYLVRAMKDYQTGERDNAIMAGIVEGLSARDLRDLAAYFAAQKGELHVKRPSRGSR